MSAQLASHESQTVSLGDWIITLLILFIPLINIIMLFVWGFSAGTPPSKQNFCRAQLIWMLIGFVLVILFLIMGGMAALLGAHAMASGGY